MKGLSKEQINSTFTESLLFLCIKYNIPAYQFTLDVRIFEEGKIHFQLCRNAVPKCEVPADHILTNKMIGLRFGPAILKNLFKTVHNAFLIQTKIENPARISLVVYQSEKVNAPCIGIIKDGKVFEVLKLAEVIEAIQLESQQLN